MADELLKRKFDAAVKTIQNLPKNGSFQPSNAMKLKFYSLYKQVTAGPVNTSRPSMFDLVGRAKWDAWNSLGKMTAAEAMQAYVDEIVSAADNLEDSPDRDQFLAVMAEKPKSAEVVEEEEEEDEDEDNSIPTTGEPVLEEPAEDVDAAELVPKHPPFSSSPGASSALSESDTEDFCDTLENLSDADLVDGDEAPAYQSRQSLSLAPGAIVAGEEEMSAAPAAASSGGVPVAPVLPSTMATSQSSRTNVSASNRPSNGRYQGASQGMHPSAAISQPATVGYISSQVSTLGDSRPPLTSPSAAASLMAPTAMALHDSLKSLANDVTDVNARLSDVEAGLQGLQQGRAQTELVREARRPRWWPFEGWDRRTVLAFFLWPVFANFILQLLGRRRRPTQ